MTGTAFALVHDLVLLEAIVIEIDVVKRLVGVWPAFGWVLEWTPAYDESERLTTNSRSFIIDTGC